MAKYQKKKSGMGVLVAVLAVVLILLITAAVFILPRMHQEPTQAEEPEAPKQTEVLPTAAETTSPAASADASQPQETAAATQAPTFAETQDATESVTVEYITQFPVSLDSGNLQITSLFPFTGMNPDCNLEEGTDIAAITLKNTSGTYLAKANVFVMLADGTWLSFTVTDLPDGMSATAFDLDNQSMEQDAACAEVSCEAVYDSTASMAADKVAVSVDGMTVNLTNISGGEISQIDVYCRSPLGEEYFGGITYQYTVNDLSADESTSIVAYDCILGMVEVVRVVVK